ncbi:hypothetical protein [Burkholderia glumae]|uniref:hypothetical protein n=1 Tax=Burkholderia glumae TaxID=337 RepID=UPI0021503F7A|nr:hypothetical protein [Burkholderia glumae]
MTTSATLDPLVLSHLIQGWPDTVTSDLISSTDNVDRLFACYLTMLDEYESDDLPEDPTDERAMHDLRDRLEELIEDGNGSAQDAVTI